MRGWPFDLKVEGGQCERGLTKEAGKPTWVASVVSYSHYKFIFLSIILQ